jgi:hypothetical protein
MKLFEQPLWIVRYADDTLPIITTLASTRSESIAAACRWKPGIWRQKKRELNLECVKVRLCELK